MHSSNPKCNAYQIINSLFLQAVSASERTTDWAAHSGMALSTSSGHNMINALSLEAAKALKTVCREKIVGLAFDNLDFKFRGPEGMAETTFKSVTSATFLPTIEVTRNDLKCADVLWELNPNNRRLSNPDILYQPEESDLNFQRLRERGPLWRRFEWHIASILVESTNGAFAYLKSELGAPLPSSIRIPVDKKGTMQYPARLMDIAEGSKDGCLEVMLEMLKQAGIAHEELNGHVRLVHGDLASLDLLEAIQRSRSLQTDPNTLDVQKLKFVAPVMGIFHLEVAALDAIWRTHCIPSIGKDNQVSPLQLISHVRPSDYRKYERDPGYRRMQDLLSMDLKARILDIWTIEARRVSAKYTSLRDFAESRQTWLTIESMAQMILQKYIFDISLEIPDDLLPFARPASRPGGGRLPDQLQVAGALWLRDCLLYRELTHARRHGDVGRIEDTYTPLISMFISTSKHKYARALFRHIITLRRVYTEPLAHAIRMNCLINPTGKPDGFRAVDWQVERNNLSLKVIHSGEYSNHSIDLLIKRSPLIEIFREALDSIEENFYIVQRTSKHAKPDDTLAIKKLMEILALEKAHSWVAGRRIGYRVKDTWQEGGTEWAEKLKVIEMDRESAALDDEPELTELDLAE